MKSKSLSPLLTPYIALGSITSINSLVYIFLPLLFIVSLSITFPLPISIGTFLFFKIVSHTLLFSC